MSQLLILPILIPLFTAIVAILFKRQLIVQKIAGFTGSGAALLVSVFIFRAVQSEGMLVSQLGNWPAPFGIVLVADRLASPAQGFALGLLSGAGFALAESLFATITPDDSWAAALSMRAFSGSMHMLASGLVGWGIAYARLEKRYFRLFGLTVLAMLLHGFWNMGAVLTAAGGLRAMVVMPDVDIPGTIMALGGAGLLFVLIGGTLIALLLLNRKLRTAEPVSSSEEPTSVVG